MGPEVESANIVALVSVFLARPHRYSSSENCDSLEWLVSRSIEVGRLSRGHQEVESGTREISKLAEFRGGWWSLRSFSGPSLGQSLALRCREFGPGSCGDRRVSRPEPAEDEYGRIPATGNRLTPVTPSTVRGLNHGASRLP